MPSRDAYPVSKVHSILLFLACRYLTHSAAPFVNCRSSGAGGISEGYLWGALVVVWLGCGAAGIMCLSYASFGICIYFLLLDLLYVQGGGWCVYFVNYISLFSIFLEVPVSLSLVTNRYFI